MSEQKLSESYTEVWGLRFEGGEERTYSLMASLKALEAKLEAMGRFVFDCGLDEQYDAWAAAQQEQEAQPRSNSYHMGGKD